MGKNLQPGCRDPRKYERDCGPEPEETRIVATLRDIAMVFILALILLAAFAALMFLPPAHADEWTPADQPCTPTVSDYDHAYQIDGAVAAAVWWCDQPDGLYTRFIAGTSPSTIGAKEQGEFLAKLAMLQLSGTDPLELIKRVIVREATPAEAELVAKIEIAHAPHCYVIGTAATAAVLTQTAQGTLGPAKLDAAGVGIRVPVGAPVSCADRLAKETLKRYCSAATLTDTKGRRVEAETWVACKIERAPAGGWQ
jgi:hypothetical protein